MKIRVFIIFVVFCSILVPAKSYSTSNINDKPNIIYILVDDLGYGDVNFSIDKIDVFNNPFIKTPNLAKLAQEGMVMTQHYAASPVCSPSRAGLLTGRTPTRCNINLWINDKKFNGKEFLRNEEITIAEKCLEAGYETAIFGKWHLNCGDWTKKENWLSDIGTFPNHQGFQHGMVSKENPHLSYYMESNSQKNPGDFYTLDGELLGTLKGYSSQIITDSALVYLKNRDKNKPFFLYLPYDAPHERIYNPDEYDDMYNTGDPNKDAYYANVTYLDHQIGRLLHGLKEMKLEENTILFFSSDNGPEVLRVYYGSWRSYGTAYPLFGQKRSLFEGGIRVPGIIRWKGQIMPGISHEPNSTLDVLPTICELLEVDLSHDKEIDGASMVGHLLDRKNIERKKPLYWQFDYPEIFELTGTGYDSRFDGTKRDLTTYSPSVSIRSGNYVLRGKFEERFVQPTEFVLFDVINDPLEKNELSKTKTKIFNGMKSQLIDIYNSANNERKNLSNN